MASPPTALVPSPTRPGEPRRPSVAGAPGLTFEEELGRGGFGVVWRARWRLPSGIEKQVAVKLLRPDLPQAEDVARRMRDEARMLSRLHHRAIVRVEDLLVLDGGPAVVTEFVDGADLRALSARGPVPPRAAAELLAEVASALEAAHDGVSDGAGARVPLIHRDLKPANLRVTRWGEVKLLDFGAARADMVDRESATRMLTMGTPDYLAPEAELGAAVPASDLYALGIVGWELRTGERMGRLSRQRQLHGEQVGRALARLGADPWGELLRGLLAWSADARPDARATRERLEALAREARGPSLRAWAEQALDAEAAEAAEGTASSIPGPADGAPPSPPAGSVPAGSLPAPSPAPVAPRPERARWPVGLVAAAGGLLGGLLAAILVAVGALLYALSTG